MDTMKLIPGKIQAAETLMAQLVEQDKQAEQRLAELQAEGQRIMQLRNEWGVLHQRQQERVVALKEILDDAEKPDEPALTLVPSDSGEDVPESGEEASGE